MDCPRDGRDCPNETHQTGTFCDGCRRHVLSWGGGNGKCGKGVRKKIAKLTKPIKGGIGHEVSIVKILILICCLRGMSWYMGGTPHMSEDQKCTWETVDSIRDASAKVYTDNKYKDWELYEVNLSSNTITQIPIPKLEEVGP